VLRCERRPLGRASTTYAALFHQKCDSERIKITIKYETSKPNSTELNGNNHNSSRGFFQQKSPTNFTQNIHRGRSFFKNLHLGLLTASYVFGKLNISMHRRTSFGIVLNISIKAPLHEVQTLANSTVFQKRGNNHRHTRDFLIVFHGKCWRPGRASSR